MQPDAASADRTNSGPSPGSGGRNGIALRDGAGGPVYSFSGAVFVEATLSPWVEPTRLRCGADTEGRRALTRECSASGAAKGSATVVPFVTLMTLLPGTPAGWTAEEPSGASYTIDDGQWTIASRTLRTMTWATGNPGTRLSRSRRARATTGGAGSAVTLPWEHSTRPASYGARVGVNERFMVHVSIEDSSRQGLDLSVYAINYGGIAALKDLRNPSFSARCP